MRIAGRSLARPPGRTAKNAASSGPLLSLPRPGVEPGRIPRHGPFDSLQSMAAPLSITKRPIVEPPWRAPLGLLRRQNPQLYSDSQ